jgi:hypothetical protein
MTRAPPAQAAFIGAKLGFMGAGKVLPLLRLPPLRDGSGGVRPVLAVLKTGLQGAALPDRRGVKPAHGPENKAPEASDFSCTLLFSGQTHVNFLRRALW